jgi:transposase
MNQVWMDGLKDRPRSSRPPEVSEETVAVIRRELSEKPFRMEG